MLEQRTKTKNMYTTDLKEDFIDVNFWSFDPNEKDSYQLTEVDGGIIKKFLCYIECINKRDDYFIYYRGDDLKAIDEDIEKVINKSLYKFFMIGNKGKSYYRNEKFGYSEAKTEAILSDYNKHNKLEEAIRKYIQSYDDDAMTSFPNKNLSILQAIVHLIGEGSLPDYNKRATKYISTTVGTDNLSIARRFIKSDSNGYEGVIIVGFETVNPPFYVDSDDLYQFLGENKRFKDIIEIEQEIMIMQVLFPSKICGLFYWRDGSLNFIINPWLKMKLENGVMDKVEIDVEQSEFDKYLGRSGFDKYTSDFERAFYEAYYYLEDRR